MPKHLHSFRLYLITDRKLFSSLDDFMRAVEEVLSENQVQERQGFGQLGDSEPLLVPKLRLENGPSLENPPPLLGEDRGGVSRED